MRKTIIFILCSSLIAVNLTACSTKDYKEQDINSNSEIKQNVPQEKIVIEGSKEEQKEEQKEQQKGKNKLKKVIVIDPGHANKSNLEKEPIAPGASELKIKDGGGAQGVSTGTPEYVVNLKVSMLLKDMLEQKGYTVVMTKTNNDISLGNVERAEIGNKAKADLVIRVHADSSNSSSSAGASMLIPASVNENTKAIYNESKRCGNIILNTLIEQVGMKNRGLVERSDMTGFNWSKVPVILVEMGFLSNSEEDQKLNSEEYEQKISKALTDGIEAAVK